MKKLAAYFLALIFCCLLTVKLQAQDQQLWNFDKVDIRALIEAVAAETDKNFVIDPRVSGQVTMVANKPLHKDELYQVFLSILQLHGFSAVPNGQVTHIVPNADVKQLASLNALNADPDHLVSVRVVSIQNSSAQELIAILQPLMPQWGHIAAHAPTNVLILAGPLTSIHRIEAIIQRVDKIDDNDIEVIQLQHADANELINTVSNLYQPHTLLPHRQLNLAIDTRSNSLLLKADPQTRWQINALIAQLDTPAQGEQHNSTQVIRLYYLKAVDLVKTLSEVINPQNSGSLALPIHIAAEPNTNAILVNAAAPQIRMLRSMIQQLDKRPTQVLVEAAIVEISESNSQNLGIEWGVTRPNSKPKFQVRQFSKGVGIIRSGSIQAVINALATSGDTNILATPSIVVMDNQAAEIEIGKTVSIRTTTQAPTDGRSPYTTFAREKVGLHLRVTPQINHGDSVRLIVDQANNTLAAKENKEADPVVNNSSIKTNVVVDDNAILVLGGLINNDSQVEIDKIAILGDIPGIGKLFQSTRQLAQRKNMMVFIKPQILRDISDNERVSSVRYEYMRQQQLNAIQPKFVSGNKPKAVLEPHRKIAVNDLPKPFGE